eukprot:CAMPEP_0179138172 /NCGR_PEP_ID=MMETSP0796-20121207/65969_1 /TAXON_ID=73915 /ORGANISM="Pyrodinium bahamense, Strain pbaha01" /LENGTH=251 /DNA_ID=CAMNT_0020837427 /DNA_START=35 /DNA_END=791 /DNA_ORIENTATION=+
MVAREGAEEGEAKGLIAPMAAVEEGCCAARATPARQLHPVAQSAYLRLAAVVTLTVACLAAVGTGTAFFSGRFSMEPPPDPLLARVRATAVSLAEVTKPAAHLKLTAPDAPQKLMVSGFCKHLKCSNGEYILQGVLKSGRAWYATGNVTAKRRGCFSEWLYYDPDPKRDGTVPAQWVFYGTQRAPWARGGPKREPQWDKKEYKRPPDQDYHRHAYHVTSSLDTSPPKGVSWKVNCNPMKQLWKEADISISP